MKKDLKTISLFVLSFAGLLFAGYLSGVKLFTSTCAFGESCPYFLGYPACYYGFVMYLILTIVSYLIVTGRISSKNGAFKILIVSLVGIVFAGSFTFAEIPVLFEKGVSAYVTGLPTCALGLIFYILIFIIAVIVYRKS